MIYAELKLLQNLKTEHTKEPRGTARHNKTSIKIHKKIKKKEYCVSFWKRKAQAYLVFQVGLLEEDGSQTNE